MGKLATVVVEAKQAKYRVRKQRESTANTKKRLNGTDWLDLLSIITTPTLVVEMELEIPVLDFKC